MEKYYSYQIQTPAFFGKPVITNGKAAIVLVYHNLNDRLPYLTAESYSLNASGEPNNPASSASLNITIRSQFLCRKLRGNAVDSQLEQAKC